MLAWYEYEIKYAYLFLEGSVAWLRLLIGCFKKKKKGGAHKNIHIEIFINRDISLFAWFCPKAMLRPILR